MRHLALALAALTIAAGAADAKPVKKGKTKAVSWFKAQAPSGGGSMQPALSATGRFCVFATRLS